MSTSAPRPGLGRFVLTVLLAATGWLLLALLTSSASADVLAPGHSPTTALASTRGEADAPGPDPAWAAPPPGSTGVDGTVVGEVDVPATDTATAEQPPPPPPESTPAPRTPELVPPSSPPEPVEPAPSEPTPASAPAPTPAPDSGPAPDPVPLPAPAPDQPGPSISDPLLPLPGPAVPAEGAVTPEVPDAEPAPAPSGADVAVLPVGQLAGALQTAALDPTAAPTAGPDLAATVVPGTATVALDGPPAETDATTPGWAAPSEPGAPTPVSVCTNVTGTGRGSPPVLATSSRQPAPTGAPVVAAVAPTPPAPDPTPPAPPLPSPPPPLAPPPAPTTGVTASSGCAFAGGAQDDDPALHDAVSSTSATVAACAASVRQIELAAELATDDGHTPGSRPD